MSNRGEAGFRGAEVRSDCWSAVEPRDAGGIDLTLTSKVETLYGDRIRSLVAETLAGLGVANAAVEVDDRGALPFVIAARLETAVRRALPDVQLPAPPVSRARTRPGSPRDRFRRTRLYLPGNEPKFMLNAALHRPDGIILDLEDSVAPSQKDAARVLVRNALGVLDFGQAERMVRINQGELGLADLDAVIPAGVELVLVPKCERSADARRVAERIATIRDRENIAGRVHLMPIIESAAGVINAYEIASAHESVVAIAIGLEDYTADLGVPRTPEGRESLWARSMVVNAARAAGVQPIDSVFSDVADVEALRRNAIESRAMGFDGMGCIHPRQIRVIHEAFAPEPAALDRAKRIVRVFEDAEARGLGVVSLGSKMIDPPVVKRAIQIVEMAVSIGLLPADWRAKEES